MAEEPRKAGPRRDARNADAGREETPRDFITENLQALFRGSEAEPLPETLLALLDRLAREEER